MSLAGALAVLGAVALLVGLSLDWYEPSVSAWTAFEIVDLLLAAIAIGVVGVALGRSPTRPSLEATVAWLPIAAAAAIVLVLASIINPPPAAIDRSVEIGAWISLAGAALLVIAAVLSTTEVSVVVAMRPRQRERARARAAEAEAALAAEEGGWQPVEEPAETFEEPEPPPEQPTDENPIEIGGEEPFEEDVEAIEEPEPEDEPGLGGDDTETQPLPPRREE